MKNLIYLLSAILLAAPAEAGLVDSRGFDTNAFTVNTTAGTVTANTNRSNMKALATQGNLASGNGHTWFVAPSPLGNDTNTGMSVYSPFLSTEMATRTARGGDTIHLMDGTNNTTGSQIDSVFPYSGTIQLSNSVNWVSDPNAWLVLTNSLGGCVISQGLFVPHGNNLIKGLKLLINDFAGNSETALGYSVNDPSTGHTNVVFEDMTLITYGTGVHFELSTAGTTNLIDWTIKNSTILGNAAPFVLKGWRNMHLKVISSDVTLLNFTNVPVCNNKPLRVVNLEPGGSANFPYTNVAEFVSCKFHLSDVELSASNRPAYLVWTTGLTARPNYVTFTGCSIEWLNKTNAASQDLSTNGFGFGINMFGCYHADGSPITYAAADPPNFGYMNGSSIGGAITFVTNATTLVTSAEIMGTANGFNLGFLTSGGSQQTFSNYFTIILPFATSTKPVVAQAGLCAFSNTVSGLVWTNSVNGLNVCLLKMQLYCTSNTVSVTSLGSTFGAGTMNAIGVTVVPQ